MKACNQDLYDSTKFYCLEGLPQPAGFLYNSSQYLEFITSQDKPSLQPPPSVISVNSSSIQVSVDVPIWPNGIVLLFEIWFSLANDTQTRTLACLIDDLYDPNDFE